MKRLLKVLNNFYFQLFMAGLSFVFLLNAIHIDHTGDMILQGGCTVMWLFLAGRNLYINSETAKQWADPYHDMTEDQKQRYQAAVARFFNEVQEIERDIRDKKRADKEAESD